MSYNMQQFVTDLLQRWHLHPYVWNLLLLGAAILLGLIISGLFSLFIKKQSGDEIRFSLAQSLLRHLTTPLSILLPVLLFSSFIPLMRIDQSIKSYLASTTEIILIVLFAWALTRLIKVGQDIIHYKVNINTANNLRQRMIITQLIYIRRVATIIIVLIAIGAILLSFDTLRKIGTGLLTGVGIGGIIIGIAAQSSLTNLLAGFQIAFTQPIRIDDEVVVENEFGKIEELTLTYVVVRLWDNRRMILPINYFLTKPFQNWTRTTSDIIGSVYFYVDYTISVDWMRTELMNLVKDHALWDKRTAGLTVTDLKKEVMEVRAIVSSSSSGNNFNLRCYIREQMIKRITQTFPDGLPKLRGMLTGEEQTPTRSA